jgi:hypothetical protein
LYVGSGRATLSGTPILSNTATDDGGGVCVSSNSYYTQTAGTIQGNAAADDGGGIYNSGDTIIGGGEIYGNTAPDGSALYQYWNSELTTTAPFTFTGNVYQEYGWFDGDAHPLRIEGDLTLREGLFDAPSDFTLTGPFTHTGGTYHQIQDVTGSNDVGFPKAGGVIVNANGEGDLGSTEVTIRAGIECTTMAGEAVRHCYNISPTTTSNVSATLTFYFWNSEIPGSQTCAAQEAWHWGPGWGIALTRDTTYGTNGRDCTAEPYSVRVKDVSEFSPFVVRESTPNAIIVRSAASQSTAPAYLAVGAAVALGEAVIVLRRRRKA